MRLFKEVLFLRTEVRGQFIFKSTKKGHVKDAVRLGATLAEEILAMGADEVLSKIYAG